jgi:NADPH:quinone reductase-like Zn-dependent oxidoreductase
MGILMVKRTKQDFAVLGDLLGTGRIVPVIDRCYRLSETAEAIRYVEQGHAKGKVVVTVGA